MNTTMPLAYRKAYETYEVYEQDYGTEVPPPVPVDLLRLTESLHLDEEHSFTEICFLIPHGLPRKKGPGKVK